jgi:exopolysaccharide biosynthesis polyprenyl glycosylphosphotransferase
VSEARSYNFKVVLMAGDALALAAALVGAAWLRYYVDPFGWFTPAPAPWVPMLQALPVVAVVWIVVLRFGGLYRLGRTPVDELVRLLRAVAITFVVLGGAAFLYRDFSYSRAVALIMMPLLFTGTLTIRMAVRFLWNQVLRLEPAAGEGLIVGTGPVARHLAATMATPRSDYRVTGLITPDPEDAPVGTVLEGVPVVATESGLAELLAAGRYRAVLVADGRIDHDAHLAIAEACLKYGVQYHVVPDIFELMLERVQINMVGGLPLLGLKGSNLTGVNFVLKRIFDLFLSALLLLLASPVMLATALGIKLSSKGPVFYTQERLGLHGRPFKLIKFRSMHAESSDAAVRESAEKWIRGQEALDEDENGEKLYKPAQDPRIFRFGAFIRKYSIDELPQLINVFKGDMSVIGPRPPVPYEAEVYREWHRRRFEALPGITGLWQVSGRNKLSFDEQARLDIDYIENWSFDLDLRIAFKTVGEVLAGNGR